MVSSGRRQQRSAETLLECPVMMVMVFQCIPSALMAIIRKEFPFPMHGAIESHMYCRGERRRGRAVGIR